eukprot:TRINITY_DN67481_c8_g8_i1.p1 TRINITY_DN67481_c8_g8~~TRINITY_DN67481_c8_g8_i1.p1  ORF type:complete len:262 (+),score=24.87 TRINITY_DN67481_c8_g8_i1:29-814(+)
MNRQVSQWGVGEVLGWLQSNGLGEFIDIFESNGIDGPSLLSLTKQDLKDELDIAKLNDRKRIWACVQDVVAEASSYKPQPSPQAHSSVSEYSSPAKSYSPTRPYGNTDTASTSGLAAYEKDQESNAEGMLAQIRRETAALQDLMHEIEETKIGDTPPATRPQYTAQAYQYQARQQPQYTTTQNYHNTYSHNTGHLSNTSPTRTRDDNNALDKALGSYDTRTRMLSSKVDYQSILAQQALESKKLEEMQKAHDSTMRAAGLR